MYQRSKGLSVQQMQLILYYLKSQFNCSYKDIVYSLVRNQHRHTQRGQERFNPVQVHHQNMMIAQANGEAIPPAPRTRFTQSARSRIPQELLDSEKRLIKEEEIRFVARLFINTGPDVKIIQHIYPHISQQQVRSYVEHICGQVIKSVQDQLKLTHNIIIQHISTEQKRSLKTHLSRARQWLSKKCPSLLETFFKYIEKIYNLNTEKVEISYDEALRLYKVFLDISKCSFVDIQQIINDEDDDRNTPAYVGQEARPVPISTFTHEQKRTITELYLQLKDVMKVNKQLNSTIGPSKKWKRESLISLLKDLIRRSLIKILDAKKRYLPGQEVHFEPSQEFCQRLFELKHLEPLRFQLLKFTIAGRVTTSGLTGIINKLNGYFSDNNFSQAETQDDEVSSFLKLQQSIKRQERFRKKPGHKVQVIDLQEDDKNSVDTAEPQPKEEIEFDGVNYSEHIEIAE